MRDTTDSLVGSTVFRNTWHEQRMEMDMIRLVGSAFTLKFLPLPICSCILVESVKDTG